MIKICNIEDKEFASPTCNCCTEKAEIVISIIKEVSGKELLISLCGDCYNNLYKKMSSF